MADDEEKYEEVFDFTGLRFDDAVRLYLSRTALPGESCLIDRLMEKFSIQYNAQNPDVFDDPDCAYILCYSMIMLNTDAHLSPDRKKKHRMTEEQFIKNHDGMNFSQDFLSQMYYSIKEKQIKTVTQ
eukprot:CAMPEP_0201513982 /NCGR_PEP_ID=MMETSP0161_2-20130828/5916_1 /ASSEMBLY_ACC=CAM_ASM_000251 /TAXON_ID=180227 /ORGANISM="Neoparamoeba aestuarina, Strain SoJaBio B1-5/56/2" /LENGTH=126 /DNA_ID=CAMNT_0047910389 /DNA_START=69 /DNA_END=446 /DNA_ORIENTATION=-